MQLNLLNTSYGDLCFALQAVVFFLAQGEQAHADTVEITSKEESVEKPL
jgi:hypothetical protein